MKTSILIAGNSAIERQDDKLIVKLEKTPIDFCIKIQKKISGNVKIIVPFDLSENVCEEDIYNQIPNTKAMTTVTRIFVTFWVMPMAKSCKGLM